MQILIKWKLIFIIAVLLTPVACNGRRSQQANDADVRIIAAVESMQVGQTELVVTLTDSAGTPINDATVSVKGDMSHAGMTPVLANVSDGTNGIYKMPFEWTMGGDWVVTVNVLLQNGRFATRQFNFSITN